MNSEQKINKNTEKIDQVVENERRVPANSIFIGKDKNGNIMYQLGRFIISYVYSSSEDLCALGKSETEKLEKKEKDK